MARYAEKTAVSSAKSRAEIEQILSRYGATGFIYGWQTTNAVIAFEMENRRIQFTLQLPARDSAEFLRDGRGYVRAPTKRVEAYEQSVRQRWRALALVIKAKLEAVESEITVFEDEFMAHIVLPDGKTVSEHVRPAIARSYETGTMQALLPAPGRA